MQGRLLEVLRLEHEEEMAKSTAKVTTSPSLQPAQALVVLRKIYEKGTALLSKRPIDGNAAEAWAATGREMIIKAFGSDSANVLDFTQPGMYAMPKENSPAGWEELRAENIRGQLSTLESCIEQLELVSGTPGGSSVAAAPALTPTDRVFIGHGGSAAWREVKDFVVERLHLKYEEFNREAAAGLSTAERLEAMRKQSVFAILVMTAEDEHKDGKQHARENVIHETGFFQGHLGFRRAIVLLEEGCEEFSNIKGLTQIRFKKGQVSATFEEIRRTLEREGLLPK